MRRTLIALTIALVAMVALAGHRNADSYVLRDGDITYMIGKGMSAEELKAIQKRHGSQFLWARRLQTTLLIRDAETLDMARAIVQRNVNAETERRMATIVDAAVRKGVAREVR